ncbi:hypothetical protein BY458DRAFT_430914 [Sporodiniella umbellata]|nr:hypothetical protein BY458DRAFT_430914 [Sporodiniella umbellata]
MTIIARSVSIIVFLIAHIICVSAQVNSISKCKTFRPRGKPPKDVTDLRIDDIKVVGAIGDSIIAGFGILGVNHGPGGSGVANVSFLSESRGQSFAIGGDPGAVTVANFIKHFNPRLKGSSVFVHPVTRCMGDDCNDILALHYPMFDHYNGALSGPITLNLHREVDYLIKEMKKMPKKRFQESWKLITMQIGSNDQCHSCKDSESHLKFTPELYGKHVEEVIERIQKEIPRVVINLFGSFKISGLVRLVRDQNEYCHFNKFLGYDKECACSKTEKGLEEMDDASDAYNVELQKISEKYKGQVNGSFAVLYNPAPVNLQSFPLDAISNVDCFHPNLKGHRWFAKIYCPTENDRLPIA